MYIDNQIKMFRISWTPITLHVYERTSRSKWTIKLSYACGAEMFLENQPDDLIQCLVLGAFNSRKDIKTELKEFTAEGEWPAGPVETWRDLQTFFIDE